MQVSVICPVYNTDPGMLRAAAMSVLGSAHRVAQLILSDDASTNPATVDETERLSRVDSRVHLLRGDRNKGPAHARNKALAAVVNEWTAFIDADDLWLPNHVERARVVLDSFPEAEWIATNHASLNSLAQQVPSQLLSDRHPGRPLMNRVSLYTSPDVTRVLASNYWLHLGGCFVKTIRAKNIHFSEQSLYSEDWLFFLCLSTITDLFYVDDVTYLLRRQHQSLTTSARRLKGARLSGKRAALACERLKPFRKQLRWALHTTYKELAANNLLVGNRVRAMRYALQAYAMDPRDIQDIVRFGRITLAYDRAQLRQELQSYTSAELVGPAGLPEPSSGFPV